MLEALKKISCVEVGLDPPIERRDFGFPRVGRPMSDTMVVGIAAEWLHIETLGPIRASIVAVRARTIRSERATSYRYLTQTDRHETNTRNGHRH